MAPGHALASGARPWVVALAMLASPDAAEAAAPVDEVPNEEDARKAAAKAEVAAARAAFSTGDYATAIERYEAAMAILPATKLHYNIAVCHQRLALAAASAEERTRARDQAIESYNRYLELNPRADDRLEVAETIRELGGTPVTMPTLKPLFDGDEPVSDPDEDSATSDGSPPGDGSAAGDGTTTGSEAGEAAPEPASKRERPYPHHGRFGFNLAGGFSPTMRAAEAVDAVGLFAIDLHGGGFVGRKRRFLLAAHTALYTGATARPDGLSFYGYSLGLLAQQTWVVGREAVQIGFGGVAAVTGQGLNTREDVAAPVCSLERGAQAASRSGGLFAPRFDLGLLLGSRRRGMISLLVQPSFAVLGDGPRGEQCSGDETPWTALGIRQRWQFQLWAGAGFSFRF